MTSNQILLMAIFFGPAWAVAGSFLAMKFAISASNSSSQAACQAFAVKKQDAKVDVFPGVTALVTGQDAKVGAFLGEEPLIHGVPNSSSTDFGVPNA